MKYLSVKEGMDWVVNNVNVTHTYKLLQAYVYQIVRHTFVLQKPLIDDRLKVSKINWSRSIKLDNVYNSL